MLLTGIPRLRLGDPMSMTQILAVYNIHDDALTSFLQAVLRSNPSDRASADELLQHEWLADVQMNGTD